MQCTYFMKVREAIMRLDHLAITTFVVRRYKRNNMIFLTLLTVNRGGVVVYHDHVCTLAKSLMALTRNEKI